MDGPAPRGEPGPDAIDDCLLRRIGAKRGPFAVVRYERACQRNRRDAMGGASGDAAGTP